jgi:hypothetical protein
MAHESEGHRSVISVDQEGGASVARCLVRDCDFKSTQANEAWAVNEAQQHWERTRQRA